MTDEGLVKVERALISVYHKEGIVEMGQGLADLGVEILSTGGTARALTDAGVSVTDVSTYTGFPEMLDGRVKTLHPAVHGGILYVRGDETHQAAVEEHGIQSIDLVVVNLYPFEETVLSGASRPAVIDQIDIGGPTMLRSAGKNHAYVAAVVHPGHYGPVLDHMRQHGGHTTMQLRAELAGHVFEAMANYNQAISTFLLGDNAKHYRGDPLLPKPGNSE